MTRTRARQSRMFVEIALQRIDEAATLTRVSRHQRQIVERRGAAT
jgi:hypothetical protein